MRSFCSIYGLFKIIALVSIVSFYKCYVPGLSSVGTNPQ